jgi:hypothetical protein
MKPIRIIIFGLLVLFFSKPLLAQDTTNQIIQLSTKTYRQISSDAKNLQEKLAKKEEKTLSSFEKQESRIRKKLARIDSLAAKNIFSDADERYKALQDRIKNPGKITQYIPHLDSLSTSLKFLGQTKDLLAKDPAIKDKIENNLSKVRDLESEFQKAEYIKQFIKERKTYLKAQLEKLGFARQLKKMNKQVYYYCEQLKEYQAALKDPRKAEKRALELLAKTKLFKDFMAKNSMLASLFRMPGDINDPEYQASLAGLQTRTQVNGLIQQQIAAGGPNGMAQFQQNLQQAQSQLQELKGKLLKYGSGNSEDEMPDFKPNGQKTKSFLQRLEYGTNMQTTRSNGFFPVTSDLGLSMGYKLNEKSIIGIGASYKNANLTVGEAMDAANKFAQKLHRAAEYHYGVMLNNR